ncbi:MAG TPA: MarC family protein [Chloroflexota bacterium]
MTSLAQLPLKTFLGALLLAFPTLFSIVNPLGSALIFREATQDRSPSERRYLATRVSIYTAFLLVGSVWIGSLVLAFFGISLGALRVAGGLVVTVAAWGLLMEPERHEDRKVADAAPQHGDPEDVAFFPLTMPLTAGAGTIAIAIALASQQPADDIGRLSYLAGTSGAALAIAALVWICYAWSDRVIALLGVRGARIVSRLTAFILLCVGIQIISTGVTGLAATILQASRS